MYAKLEEGFQEQPWMKIMTLTKFLTKFLTHTTDISLPKRGKLRRVCLDT
jgi:hypothetical protein